MSIKDKVEAIIQRRMDETSKYEADKKLRLTKFMDDYGEVVRDLLDYSGSIDVRATPTEARLEFRPHAGATLLFSFYEDEHGIRFGPADGPAAYNRTMRVMSLGKLEDLIVHAITHEFLGYTTRDNPTLFKTDEAREAYLAWRKRRGINE